MRVRLLTDRQVRAVKETSHDMLAEDQAAEYGVSLSTILAAREARCVGGRPDNERCYETDAMGPPALGRAFGVPSTTAQWWYKSAQDRFALRLIILRLLDAGCTDDDAIASVAASVFEGELEHDCDLYAAYLAAQRARVAVALLDRGVA